MLLNILISSAFYISSTVWFASITASFGMMSWPMLFPRFNCVIACLISLVVIVLGFGSLSISLFLLLFHYVFRSLFIFWLSRSCLIKVSLIFSYLTFGFLWVF